MSSPSAQPSTPQHSPMQADLQEALSTKFPGGNFPPWVKPFLSAVDQLDQLYEEEEKRLGLIAHRKALAERIGIPMEEIPAETDEAEDPAHLERAESDLLSAVDLSEGKEALVFNWLTSLYIKTEEWSKARAAALKAVELEPFQSTSIFRLSLCFEKEREYIKAHDWLKKGMSLIPAAERQPHKAKLARLREQSDDMKANVFRGDPFDILPLEVIIAIMKIGLEFDNGFALRASLVNRMWHSTLVQNCPELWGNFPLLWKELKDKSFNDKREAWIKRSGGSFHTITIEGMTSTGVTKIPKHYTAYFRNIKTLHIDTKDNRALFRLCERLGHTAAKVEHLYIDGGNMDQVADRIVDRPDTLHCELVATESELTLKTMDIRNIDFRETDPFVILGAAFFGRRFTPPPGMHPHLPALQRLIVNSCAFDLSDATPNRNTSAEPRERFLGCPLHQTLRGSKDNLKHLEVIIDFETVKRKVRQTTTADRINMTALQSLVLPPWAIRAVDIRAPNLEKLSFEMSDWLSKHDYERRPADDLLPMIPTIEDSPVTHESISRLTTLEFECCTADTIPRIEEWLSRASNLTRLVIRGSCSVSAGAREAPNLEIQVQRCIVQALADHPEWVPKMVELSISGCAAREGDLVKLVKSRKESDTAAALTTLEWDRSPWAAEDSAWLHREVPNFHHGIAGPTGQPLPSFMVSKLTRCGCNGGSKESPVAEVAE